MSEEGPLCVRLGWGGVGGAVEVWNEGWRWRDRRQRRRWVLRELMGHDSNKNKMMRLHTLAVTGSVRQNFSVTLQGSDTIFIFFFFLFFFYFFWSVCLKPRRISVDWLQVSICCIMCHHTEGTQLLFFVCGLLLFASLKDMCLDCFFSMCRPARL